MQNQNLDRIFDLFVIGGGITGANILWDATLRGLSCILAEKNDYASGTSQATSKMIHGGLRYLKNMEIGLVRESLRERRFLAKISPHAMRPLGYLVPIYDKKNKLMLRAGLSLYDLLSLDKNHSISSDLQIPYHEFLSRERTIAEDPNIPREHLLGAFLYFDYANINPERHTTEFIFSAKNRGALAFNYAEVIKVNRKNELFLVEVRNKKTNQTFIIQTKALVNACGPWADYMEAILGIGESKPLLRSKGIHVVVRNLTGRHTYVVQTKKKSHLFIIPWRGLTILGTTDVEFKNHPDDFRVTKNDIKELIHEVNEYSNFKISTHDIRSFYGGLRPLVADPGDTSTYNASRKPEIIHHKDSGVSGFFTAMGGKYTTSRQVAESLVDLVCEYLPGKWKTCETKDSPLDGGRYSDFPSLFKNLRTQFPRESDEKLYILSHRYGSNAENVLKTRSALDFGTIELGFHTDEIYFPEELTYILQKEDVFCLEDFYFRRSGIGNVGMPPLEAQKKISEIYKKITKKTETEFKKETKIWQSRYEILD
jgi:glycerol-3-phosphate dehydrogenase